MSDGENDEDLKRAIALSLQENTPPRFTDRNIIEISDDDDDLDAPVRARAISTLAASKQAETGQPSGPSPDLPEGTPSRGVAPPAAASSIPTITPATRSGLPGLGLLGLNRKQMEEERLARLKTSNLGAEYGECEGAGAGQKRKAGIAFRDIPTDRNVKAKTPVDASMPKTIISEPFSHPGNHSLGSVPTSGMQYPDGIVKKTWVKGYDRSGDDIKIEEVLQKDTLQLAVMSAFQIDAQWIADKINDRTKVVWILQAKSDAEKENWRDKADPNYRFCFPYMSGVVNCMHSKLQLLSHGSYLRIAIPSANLVPYDWGETGVMENVCFLIDLPKLPLGQIVEPTTQFGIELSYFLVALGLDLKIVDSLKRFDFSRTETISFVHSIGGSHNTSASLQRTGYCGLGKAVTNLGYATEKALDIDFLAASIGSLNRDFIRAMYLACQGNDGLTEYQSRINKSTRARGFESKPEPSDDILSRCRVFFPTEQTVSESKGGKGAAGTICIQEKFYNSTNFPQQLMRDCVSKRRGLLMHSKMIFIRSSNIALAYVGSANLSEAAWGKLVTDRTTKEPKLNCRNWECGVLLPVRGSVPGSLDIEDARERILEMEVFEDVVPVPMVMPGERYGTRKPWYFSQH